MSQKRAHPRNVPGDFYVEDGCCTLCDMPRTEAPDLFAICDDPADYQHCFVSKQPGTPQELDRMVSAIECAELYCIRYRGSDRSVQSRLVELGEGPQCDVLLPELTRRSQQVRSRLRRQALIRRWKQRLST